MTNYPTLHWDTNESKMTVSLRTDINVNEYDKLSNITLSHKCKMTVSLRTDINVNEHDKLSNITLRHKWE